MRKRLSSVGNSLGIVIEKPILELLKIDRDTELEMRTDGHALIIEPVRSSNRKERVSKAIDTVLSRHERVMKKLAK
jgi:antitoxin MazE